MTVPDKARPILMKGWGVRATLEGLKTQTRRVVKPPPIIVNGKWRWQVGTVRDVDGERWRDVTNFWDLKKNESHLLPNYSPYGKPKDFLWVREAFAKEPSRIVYRADRAARHLESDTMVYLYSDYEPERWQPSIFLSKADCRLVLRIDGVRAQRLQAITDEECIAEGIGATKAAIGVSLSGKDTTLPRTLFADAWNRINAKPRYRKAGGEEWYESYPWGGGIRTETHNGLPHRIYGNPWVYAIAYHTYASLS